MGTPRTAICFPRKKCADDFLLETEEIHKNTKHHRLGTGDSVPDETCCSRAPDQVIGPVDEAEAT